MRLLHTETLQFSEYVSPNDAPPYIIASHRWLHDEVSYWEFVKDRANADPEIRKKAGMDKILRFCGYINLWGSWPAETKIPQHVWIDTCCINKDSSAELQEAITSMFEWYARAWCCLAWLHDVKGDAASLEGSKDFSDSVWFTRGWTLQELLAPKTVIFLDQQWRRFGHKSSTAGLQALASKEPIESFSLGLALNPLISQVTGIAEPILWDYTNANNATMEERQSWMNKRQTTRREDRAYCMLGICEVFMPLNYGEGANADKRLERKIQKQLAMAQLPKLSGGEFGDREASTEQCPPVRNGKAPGKLVTSAKAGRTSNSTLSDAAKKMLDADVARAKLQAAGRDNALRLI